MMIEGSVVTLSSRFNSANDVDDSTGVVRFGVGTPADVLVRAHEDQVGLIELAKLGLVASQDGERHSTFAGGTLETGAVRLARSEPQKREALAKVVEQCRAIG